MQPTLWMVQTNLGNAATPEAIKSACESNGLLFHGVKVIPFSDNVPDLVHDGPVMAYGATRFIRNVVASRRWRPGAFFDDEIFTVTNCLRAWGKWMVNSDSVIVRMDAVQALPFAAADEIFVRPDRDLKEFSGSVMTFGAFRDWAATLSKGGLELDGSLLVAVAAPKQIRSEWRVFAVDTGRVIAASRYRIDGEMAPQAGAPSKVVSFVESRLKEWMPAPALALDVAEVDGELRILELTDMHSAGHYAADVEAIVVEASKVAARHWAETR